MQNAGIWLLRTWRRCLRWGIPVALLILLLVGCQAGDAPAPAGGNTGRGGSAQLAAPFSLSHRALVSPGIDVADLSAPAPAGTAWQLDPALLPKEQAGKPKQKNMTARPPMTKLEGLGDGPAKRMNAFIAQRAYPKEYIPEGAFVAALQQTWNMAPIHAMGTLPAWQNIGPGPMENSKMGQQAVSVSGRVRALVVDPQDSNIVYLGAAQGGVWKTTNGGASWTPLTDNQASLAVGTIALDPSNHNTIYVGTGEPTPGLDNYYGAGILKSTDGGTTWTHLGASVFTGLGIAKIIVDPHNPNVVYVASSTTGTTGPSQPARGIFESTDGGQTWKALLSCQGCQGASDLVMDSNTSSTLYAGFWGYGVYKSTDSGAHWTQLTSGLPNPQQYQVGRVILSISPSTPSVLYASFHLTIPQQYNGALLFKSTDSGGSWAQVNLGGYNYCSSQCWYDNVVEVHPTDPNTLYLGGSADYKEQAGVFKIQRVVVKTTDSGANWADLSPNDSPAHSLHPDMHVIAFDPQNANTIWVGNDGGVWKSTDGGTTWQDMNTNLATLQFTGIAVDPNNTNIIQGGMQDNNKAFTTDGGATPGWTATDVGDGGFAAIDPSNSNIWYGTRFGKSFSRNDQGTGLTGQWPMKVSGIDQQDRALFYPPYTADPSTQGVLYFGTYRLYRTTDRGDNWTAISGDLSAGQGMISTIAVAPSDSKTIYVGTSDGNIQVTTNTGGSWQNTTKAPLPNRYVSRIAVLPTDPHTAYAVFNGFNTNTPGQSGHVFKTTNSGTSWQDISSNLPDVPALSIVLDRNHAGTIYIGTDTGVFRTTSDGQSWEAFNNGMPTVAVVDLVMSADGATLFAATHGRSVFKVSPGGAAPPTNTPTSTPVPTNTPPGTPPTQAPYSIYLPLVVKGGNGQPGPTATPKDTATITPFTHTPTATIPPAQTSTPSATPTQTDTPIPAGTELPTMTPTVTPTPSDTPTATSTAYPTGQPSPTATNTAIPTATPTVGVFSDDFSSPGTGWEVSTTSDCDQGYASSNYGIAVLTYNWVCLAAAPSGAQVDGTYQVSAAKYSAATDGSVYGLVFGLDDKNAFNQFYVFWIDPAGQQYGLQKYDSIANPSSPWANLTGDVGGLFVASAAIQTGTGTNVLKVRRQGAEIKLFVNGFYLETINDNSFPTNGYVGVANWARYNLFSATAYFDDFRVSQSMVVYQDDYSLASSGWFTGNADVCQASYTGGEYRTATQPKYLCLYRAPAGTQPNGLFEAQIRREPSNYSTAYGLFFGGDSTYDNFYAFLIIPDTQSYALAKYISDTQTAGWYGITWDDNAQTAWLNSSDINGGTSTNQLSVERDGSLFQISVNGNALGVYTDTAPLSGGYFGLINWSSQYDSAIADFDNYKLTAWEPGGTALMQAASVPVGDVKALNEMPEALQPNPIMK